MTTQKRLSDVYRFSGFRPLQKVAGIFGDPKARVIKLKRTEKKRVVQTVAGSAKVSMITKCVGSETFPAETREFTLRWKSVA
jgi:hypothetical protein